MIRLSKQEMEEKFPNKSNRGIYTKKEDNIERVDFIFLNSDKVAYPNSIEGDCIHYCRSKSTTDHRAMKYMCQEMQLIHVLILKENTYYEWHGYVHYTDDLNFVIKNGKNHRYILKTHAPEHYNIKKQCFEQMSTQTLTPLQRKQLEHFWAECDRILALKNCQNCYDDICDLFESIRGSFIVENSFCNQIIPELKKIQNDSMHTSTTENPQTEVLTLNDGSASPTNTSSSSLNESPSSNSNEEATSLLSLENYQVLQESQPPLPNLFQKSNGRVKSQATLYNGLYFQSKNEALKANFMDLAEIEYLYEPSYETILDPFSNKIIEKKYSIDFFNRSQSIAIESKPFEPDETEKRKAMAYAYTYKTSSVILYGTKFVPPFSDDKKSDGLSYKDGIRGIMFKYIKKKNRVKTIHDVCWLYNEKKQKVFIGKKKSLQDKRWCHPKLIEIYKNVESSRNDTNKFIPVVQ